MLFVCGITYKPKEFGYLSISAVSGSQFRPGTIIDGELCTDM